MAYRIFFSGLNVFVEHQNFQYVDVLLVDPSSASSAHGGGHHDAAGPAASATDPHVAQMSIRIDDIAQWRLDGVLHGCGSRHFDLKGKTVVFPGDKNRVVTCPKRQRERFPADPFGEMTQLTFDESVIDMEKVRGGGKGKIKTGALNLNLAPAGAQVGDVTVTAHVRLPRGEIIALAPVIEAPEPKVPEKRARGPWNVGGQDLDDMPEVIMFVPFDQTDRTVYLLPDLPEYQKGSPSNSFVTLRADPDVAIWITNEPMKRSLSMDPNVASHFTHYYDLVDSPGSGNLTSSFVGERFVPKLGAQNVDIPICPPTLMHS